MKKKTCILFWLKSSRGTDAKAVFAYRSKPSKNQIEDDLENWASKFPACVHSENQVTYGWKPIAIPPRRQLLQQFKKVCDRKAKVKEKYETILAMLNPRDRR